MEKWELTLMVLQGYRMCGACNSKPVAKDYMDHCPECLKPCAKNGCTERHKGWGGNRREGIFTFSD